VQNNSYQFGDPFINASPNLPVNSLNTISGPAQWTPIDERYLETLGMTCECLERHVVELQNSNEELQKRVNEILDTLQEMEGRISTQPKSTKPSSKNISNQHPKVKVCFGLSFKVDKAYR
jgi:hypothetical protein